MTYDEARGLFSKAEPDYAFGETDETGKQSIATLAEFADARLEFMPTENRVYFQRTVPPGADSARGKFSIER